MTPGSQLRRLLIGFDGSPEAVDAIDLAIDLGRHLDAELTLLSVLPGNAHLETREARAQAERAARSQLDGHLGAPRARAAAAGVRLSEVVLFEGDPADALAGYAAEHGFDLVVIGSHGRERATHPGLGRVVERLLRQPRCPVLIAPDRSAG